VRAVHICRSLLLPDTILADSCLLSTSVYNAMRSLVASPCVATVCETGERVRFSFSVLGRKVSTRRKSLLENELGIPDLIRRSDGLQRLAEIISARRPAAAKIGAFRSISGQPVPVPVARRADCNAAVHLWLEMNVANSRRRAPSMRVWSAGGWNLAVALWQRCLAGAMPRKLFVPRLPTGAFVVYSTASGPGLKRVSGMSALKSTKNRKTTLRLSGAPVLLGGNRRTTAAYQIPLEA